MYKPIWFDYIKLVDDLLYLGGGATIQLVVQLYKKGMDGKSKSFHSEYVSENNYKYGVTMKRSYNSFLVINKAYEKSYAMITAKDIILMRMKLEKASKWFENNTFSIRGDELCITRKKDPIEIMLSTEKKWLTLVPVVIVKEDGTQFQGIRMNMFDTAFIDMTIDTFYGMKYFFDTVDIWTLSSSLINYFGRPEFGTNLYGTFNKDSNGSGSTGKFFN